MMMDAEEEYSVPVCNEEVDILFADDFLLLINKPAKLLSVPGRLPQNKDCMITRIQQQYPTATVCHRLDMDTSGIMLVPLCHEVHADITRQFQRHDIKKSYTAIVWGEVLKSGTIDLPIVFDWENRPRQKICYDTGKASVTHFEVLEKIEANTKLLLNPESGRKHQLRIHCREMGHPILGDELYGTEECIAASKRLLLHSTSLSFTHPITKKFISWRCEPSF